MPEQKPIKVAVFDLNKTVYHKSSKDEFYKFICFRKNIKLLDVFQIGVYTALRKIGFFNKTEFKENFFNYLDHLPPEKVYEYAREFWSLEWPKHFNTSLLERIDDLRKAGIQVFFITGGLDVYVEPLFQNFLVPDGWIATRSQYGNGTYHIIGKACKDEEKIKRLNQVLFPTPFEIVESYSDSKEAILKVAKRAFLLKDGEIIPLSAEE